MQKVDLHLEFTVGHYNGSMSLDIIYNDQLLYNATKFDNDKFVFDTLINLPGTLKFILGNKNLATDTKVDATGNIIKDKYISLDTLWLGRVPFRPDHVYHFCNYTTFDNRKLISSNWGWPGTVEINFNDDNLIKCYFNKLSSVPK